MVRVRPRQPISKYRMESAKCKMNSGKRKMPVEESSVHTLHSSLKWPVSSKSERQSYKLRRLESYQHGLRILPLSVEVCTPVSETGRAGALPAAAANFYFNKEQTPPEGDKCRVSRERRLCFADDAFHYRLCYWACGSSRPE